MSNTAFVFPGQGSQEPGMLSAFADAWPTVSETLRSIGDQQLRSLVFEADETTLRQPANTQQAVLATGLAVTRELQARTGLEPDLVAGHSLGHISAAAAGGAISVSDAIPLVRQRGQLMAMAERTAGPGTMVAVSLARAEAVTEIVSSYEEVSVAGYNSPRQTVISGPTGSVTEACRAIETQVSRARTTELDVGSGFHSSVMAPAIEPFEAALGEIDLSTPEIPIVSDVTGERHTDPAQLRTDLSEQLTAPIRWTDVVETLVENDVDRVVELPPAGTLSTLIERTTDEIRVLPVTDPSDITQLHTDNQPTH